VRFIVEISEVRRTGEMKNNLLRRGLSLIVVSCLLYLLLLSLQPLEVHASELVYTIQISSSKEVEGARKEYDFLNDKLNQEDLNYLRLEKIGQYYSVRLGKFADSMDAEKIKQSLQGYHPSALIMKAYIKNERIIKLYPRTSAGNENNISSGRSSIRKPKIHEAISADDKKKTEDPDADNQKKGDMYFKEGRLISAANEYHNAIRKDPDNPDLIVKLAKTFKKLRMLDQAIIQMKKAVDVSSNNITSRVELGKLYLSTGEPDKAKKQFLAAVKMNPGAADIHYYLGVVYMNEENYDTAWFAAKTAQSLGYENKDLINLLSILSEEPLNVPSKGNGESMYIAHIVVDTPEEAEAVLSKHEDYRE